METVKHMTRSMNNSEFYKLTLSCNFFLKTASCFIFSLQYNSVFYLKLQEKSIYWSQNTVLSF